MELVGKKTQLFGVNLHLELGCNSTTNSAPACSTSTAVDSSVSLCVQGLPEAMLNNPQMVSEALKLFIKQGTGFEAEDCSIVQGRGYLTFTDPSGKYVTTISKTYVCNLYSCTSHCKQSTHSNLHV